MFKTPIIRIPLAIAWEIQNTMKLRYKKYQRDRVMKQLKQLT